MNIAIILAGGIGSRVKGSKIPKQFIELNNKPIIIYTIEKFLKVNEIDQIIIVCHREWINHINQMLKVYNLSKNIDICEGGDSRNYSAKNAINFISNKYKLSNNSIIITHDAARPFVTPEIIKNNIIECVRSKCVNTVIPTDDTIIISNDNKTISQITNKDLSYRSQTPQTFTYEVISELYNHSFDNEIFKSSDISTLANILEYKISLLSGNKYNFKITTDEDIEIAKYLVNSNKVF
ncbi:MAG: IspD/TarI family cytidylyltransferase [Mycoplasma sp.]